MDPHTPPIRRVARYFSLNEKSNNNKQDDFASHLKVPTPASTGQMDLQKENKQLKSMLLLHLNVIQEQTDMLVAKDKHIASLQAKLDRLLERKMLGAAVAAADENVNTNVNAVVSAGTGLARPALGQQLTRGTIMKMAALNQLPGKTPVRVRPLMISLKKVVVDNKYSSKSSNGFGGAAIKMTKSEQPQQHTLIKSEPAAAVNESSDKVDSKTPALTSSVEYNSPPPSVEETVARSEGSEDNSIADKETKSSQDSEELGGGLFRFDCKDIYPSDGSPHDIPIELKFEDDDLEEEEEEKTEMDMEMEEELMEIKLDSSEEAIDETKAIAIKSESPAAAAAAPPVEEAPNVPRPPIKLTIPLLTSESLAKQQAPFESSPTKPVTIKKRSLSECSNRAPRKYSRVMSTRKLYVSRHWEELEDDELEPNSLVVPELKVGESNLEVPKWKEVDERGLDEEVATEEAPQTAEDLSEAAFLKRHAKHEADERRRKKWDIQRLREQRTIEKLKKRHCKSDIYYSLSAVGGGGGTLEDAPQAPNGTFPMSLYPGLNNVRHIETTEYLPVQAFGEPIPTLSEGEFVLPWHGGAGGEGAGSVEWIQMGNGAQAGGACSGSNSGVGLDGAGSNSNSNSNNNQHSKYSSFYVKQNSSSMVSSSSTSRIRFKRVKSQSGGGSSCGGRR